LALLRSQDGRTALIYAAIYTHADCARLLLDAGADKNAKNKVRYVVPPRLRLEVFDLQLVQKRYLIAVQFYIIYNLVLS
jgi:ankyrin repeat protein